MLFLTTSERCYVVGVQTSLREGLFVINLCPFPRGFEWFLFVTKNNSTRKQMIGALKIVPKICIPLTLV